MKETVYKAIFYSTYKDFSLLIKNILMVLEAGDFLTLVGSTQGLIREKPRQASDMASLVQVPTVKVDSTNCQHLVPANI